MDTDKPPDPPDPPDIPSCVTPTFDPFPSNTNPLSQLAEVACSVATSQKNLRKRQGIDLPTPPTKHSKNHVGRSKYSDVDKPPYIVHVSRVETQPNAGTVLHPVTFGLFLLKNNIANIIRDGVKRVGRNRVSVEFRSHQDANSFLINSLLTSNNFTASIPTYNITRMGVVSGIPADLTDEEIINNLSVPPSCGPILKARRINRKIFRDGTSEWKPTETCVLTFDGQVLPKRIYCGYTALLVERYIYPTIQCRKCCRFGHVESLCRSKPRCSKCGDDHPGDGCSITESVARCILCSGNHFATSRDCPEYGRQRAIKTVMAEKTISYAEASKSVPVVVVNSNSRTYANVTNTNKSSSQSYRKTVTLKPKSHSPLSQSYDIAAHNRVTNVPQSSQPNGCSLNNPYLNPSDNSSVIDVLLQLLSMVLTSSSQLPSNVAHKLSSLLTKFNNGVRPNIHSVEYEERVA